MRQSGIFILMSVCVLSFSPAYGESNSGAKNESPSVTDKIFNFFGSSPSTKSDKKETAVPKVSTTSGEQEKGAKKDNPVPAVTSKVSTSSSEAVKDVKKDAPAPSEPAKSAGITQDQSGVSLAFQGKTLKQALDTIKDKTGIQFKISDTLSQKTVPNDVKAENWKAAVQKLLQNYNKVEMWQEDLTKSQVWIMRELEIDGVVASKTPPAKPAAKSMSQDMRGKAPKDNKPRTVKIPENPIAEMIQGPEPERTVTVMDLDPMILLAPGVAGRLAAKGVILPADVQAAYDMMQRDGRAQPDGEIPDQVLYNRKFQSFAGTIGINLPAPREPLENLSPSY